MYTMINDEGIVIRDADEVQVAPADSVDDPEYAAYVAWVNEGNQPTVLASRGRVKIVPQSVSRRQLLRALHQAGLLTTIQEALAQPGNEEMKIDFDEATEFDRQHEALNLMAANFGFTQENVDDLFIAAAAIK